MSCNDDVSAKCAVVGWVLCMCVWVQHKNCDLRVWAQICHNEVIAKKIAACGRRVVQSADYFFG